MPASNQKRTVNTGYDQLDIHNMNPQDDNICLVIVFNHKFEKNIEILEEIYRNRFKNIFFLMPFYEGNNPKIIPVYESSYNFQGYFTQAFSRYYNPRFTHYVFIADDMLLNPAINANNILNTLELDNDSGYIQDLVPLSAPAFSWSHVLPAIRIFNNSGYIHFEQELPNREEAKGFFLNNKVIAQDLTRKNLFWPHNGQWRIFLSGILYLLKPQLCH